MSQLKKKNLWTDCNETLQDEIVHIGVKPRFQETAFAPSGHIPMILIYEDPQK